MKQSYGNHEKKSYAVKIDDVNNEFYKQPFGRQIADRRLVSTFIECAKTERVDTKGKSTMATIKAWVKENKPQQFYASWQSDSELYKDDSVQIFYISGDKTGRQ